MGNSSVLIQSEVHKQAKIGIIDILSTLLQRGELLKEQTHPSVSLKHTSLRMQLTGLANISLLWNIKMLYQ